MSVSILVAAAPQAAVNTEGLVKYLQGLFGPLFLGIVGIVALFFLFTREITRFVQFIVLAVAIAVYRLRPLLLPLLGDTEAQTAFGLISVFGELSVWFALLSVLPLPTFTDGHLLVALVPQWLHSDDATGSTGCVWLV